MGALKIFLHEPQGHGAGRRQIFALSKITTLGVLSFSLVVSSADQSGARVFIGAEANVLYGAPSPFATTRDGNVLGAGSDLVWEQEEEAVRLASHRECTTGIPGQPTISCPPPHPPPTPPPTTPPAPDPQATVTSPVPVSPLLPGPNPTLLDEAQLAAKFAQEPYVDSGIQRHRDNTPGEETRSDTVSFTWGADITPMENLLVGGGITYNHTSSDLLYNGGESDAEGVTGYLRATAYVGDYTFGGFGGYGTSNIEQSRPSDAGTITSQTNSRILFGGINVGRSFFVGDAFIGPSVGVLASRTEIDEYVDSSGAQVAPTEATLVQLSIGSSAAYYLRGDGWTITPNGGAFLLYDAESFDGNDPTGVNLRVGVDASSGNLLLGVRANATALRENQESYGGSAFISLKF